MRADKFSGVLVEYRVGEFLRLIITGDENMADMLATLTPTSVQPV